MPAYSADDAEVISKIIKANRLRDDAIFNRQCFQRIVGLNSADCWCRKAAPNGNDLPCPPQSPI